MFVKRLIAHCTLMTDHYAGVPMFVERWFSSLYLDGCSTLSEWPKLVEPDLAHFAWMGSPPWQSTYVWERLIQLTVPGWPVTLVAPPTMMAIHHAGRWAGSSVEARSNVISVRYFNHPLWWPVTIPANRVLDESEKVKLLHFTSKVVLE